MDRGLGEGRNLRPASIFKFSLITEAAYYGLALATPIKSGLHRTDLRAKPGSGSDATVTAQACISEDEPAPPVGPNLRVVKSRVNV